MKKYPIVEIFRPQSKIFNVEYKSVIHTVFLAPNLIAKTRINKLTISIFGRKLNMI